MSSRANNASGGSITADSSFTKLVHHICHQKAQNPEDVIEASMYLVDGLSVPFISRYRRDKIGALTPQDLFDLSHRLDKFVLMIKSRDAKLKKLTEDGKITDRLQRSFMDCLTTDEIDELWAPFKEKHTTNSAKAQSIPGMTELAEYMLSGSAMTTAADSQALFIKLVPITIPREHNSSIATIQQGVQYIITDILAHDPIVRQLAREIYNRQYTMQSNINLPKTVPAGSKQSLKDFQQQFVKRSNYRDYHEYNRPLHFIPHHQLLAIRRGSGQSEGSSVSSSSGVGAKKASCGSSSSVSASAASAATAAALTSKVIVSERAHENLIRRLRSMYQLPFKDNGDSLDVGALDKAYNNLMRLKSKPGATSPQPLIPWHIRNSILTACIVDAVKKSINPSLTKEALKEALKAADAGAVEVFAGNLQRLLLTPPLASFFDSSSKGGTCVASGSGSSSSTATKVNNLCVIDPGFRFGHKVVVFSVGDCGKSGILEEDKLYVNEGGGKDEDGELVRAGEKLGRMCRRHKVRLVVVGDGVGSHQALDIVRHVYETSSSSSTTSTTFASTEGKKRKLEKGRSPNSVQEELFPSHYTIVSECGASVYSASEVAQQEYPGVDISFLGCMSIGSRLVDPLSELVKIPPESLGVGMYQHDVAPKLLQHKLKEVVELCVNDVGVDLNTASIHILKYISGIDETKARNIIAHRDKLAQQFNKSNNNTSGGGFSSLEQLKDVKGIGAITFKNAAGFLRVYDGADRLDSSCIHPEQYAVARRLLTMLGGFTSGDIGISAKLQQAISDTVTAVAAGDSEVTERTRGWRKQLSLSSVELMDMLDWLSLRSTSSSGGKYSKNDSVSKSYDDSISSRSDSSTGGATQPAKKRKVGAKSPKGQEEEEEELLLKKITAAAVAAVPCRDDIRLSRGVAPQLVEISTALSSSSSPSYFFCDQKKNSSSTAAYDHHPGVVGIGEEDAPLEVGSKFIGKVKNIASFGAFVDLGSRVQSSKKNSRLRDGLLHISVFNKKGNTAVAGASKISPHHHNSHSSQHSSSGSGVRFESLTVGQQIAVVIESIDVERGRVSLRLQE